MAEKMVFMDTGVFTGIVEDIRGAADNLVFSDNALKNSDCLNGFPAGVEILEALKEVHTTSKIYNMKRLWRYQKDFLRLGTA